MDCLPVARLSGETDALVSCSKQADQRVKEREIARRASCQTEERVATDAGGRERAREEAAKRGDRRERERERERER